MLRLRVWGLTAALGAAAGGEAATAAEPARPMEQTTLVSKISGMFAPKKPKPVGPSVMPSIQAPLSPEMKADALRAEQDAYLRRVSVCTELRRVAVERGDEALVRQADELERQAAALYNARVAGLGVSRVKAPLPETATALNNFDALGLPPDQTATAKANRLTAPAAPIPASATAQVGEGRP